jgi:hypothetical protein
VPLSLSDKELDQLIERMERELAGYKQVRAARRGEEYRPLPFAGMRPLLAIQKYLHANPRPIMVKELVDDLIQGGCSYGAMNPRKNINQSIKFNIKDGKLTLNGELRKGTDANCLPEDLIGLPEWQRGKPDSEF